MNCTAFALAHPEQVRVAAATAPLEIAVRGLYKSQ